MADETTKPTAAATQAADPKSKVSDAEREKKAKEAEEAAVKEILEELDQVEDVDEETEKKLDEEYKGYDPDSPALVRDEYVTRFIMGDITASDLMGLSRDELYMIAERGYNMLTEGKLEQALSIFDGLVHLDPYDAYFYAVLGSIRQQMDDPEGALSCYEQALKLQPWNINALANRGEILFGQGKLMEAFKDFQRVMELDPEDKNPSTLRAKAIVLTMKEVLDQNKEKILKASQGEGKKGGK